MITKERLDTDTLRVTFTVDDDRLVSVVGDFNEWDPFANPLRRRSNGLRSTAIDLPSGTSYRFRYLADGGEFYDDPHADAIEPNGFGLTHSVLHAGVGE